MFDSLDHRFTKFLLESNALKFGDFRKTRDGRHVALSRAPGTPIDC